jgi:hypothetical protein
MSSAGQEGFHSAIPQRDSLDRSWMPLFSARMQLPRKPEIIWLCEVSVQKHYLLRHSRRRLEGRASCLAAKSPQKAVGLLSCEVSAFLAKSSGSAAPVDPL